MSTVASLDDDEPTIQFAFDTASHRLACVYTEELWQYDLPELFIRPPEHYGADGDVDWPVVSAMLGQALAVLMEAAMAAGPAVRLPVLTRPVAGELARFTVGPPERPQGKLALVLPPEVDALCEVSCSLW